MHLAEVGHHVRVRVSHWRFGNVSWRLVGLLGVPGRRRRLPRGLRPDVIDGDTAKPWIAGLLLALGHSCWPGSRSASTPTPAPETRLRARSMTPLGLVAGFIDAIGGGGWGPSRPRPC